MDEKKKLLQNLTKDIVEVMGESVEKIILYGSYARGDFQPQSDIDIMILTSLEDIAIKSIEDRIYDIAFEYEMSDGLMISMHIKNIEQFNYWLGALPYYDNIEREGIVLAG